MKRKRFSGTDSLPLMAHRAPRPHESCELFFLEARRLKPTGFERVDSHRPSSERPKTAHGSVSLRRGLVHERAIRSAENSRLAYASNDAENSAKDVDGVRGRGDATFRRYCRSEMEPVEKWPLTGKFGSR